MQLTNIRHWLKQWIGVITWIIDNPVHGRIYASPTLNELICNQMAIHWSLNKQIHPFVHNQSADLISHKTAYRKISQSLEG